MININIYIHKNTLVTLKRDGVNIRGIHTSNTKVNVKIKRKYTKSQKLVDHLKKLHSDKKENTTNKVNLKTLINKYASVYKEMQIDYNYFYGITVNFPEQLEKEIPVSDLENKLMSTLESIPLLEFMIIAQQLHGDNQAKREKDNKKDKKKDSSSGSKSLVGLPHFHMVVAIRGVCDKMPVIDRYFRGYKDVLIKPVTASQGKTLEVAFRKCVSYIIREGIYKTYKYSKHYLENDLEENDYVYKASKYSHIKSLIRENKLLYLDQIGLYLGSKQLIIYSNNKLYKKMGNTKNSYEYVGGVESLYLYYENVANYIRNILGQHYIEFRDKSLDKHNFPNEIFDPNYLEFKNGLYNLLTLSFEENEEIKLNSGRYYGIEYDNNIIKEPKLWLSLLDKVFNTEDVLEIKNRLYYYLNTNEEAPYKAKCWFIQGVSSTGKTKLITDIIRGYHGPDAIGSIGSDNGSFNFAKILNKPVICIDEFTLRKEDYNTFKNVIDGTPTIINRKNKEQVIYSNKAPIVATCNNDPIDLSNDYNDPSIKNQIDSMQSRIKTIKSDNKLGLRGLDMPTEVLKQLKEECYLIYIYIYRNNREEIEQSGVQKIAIMRSFSHNNSP